MPWFCLNTCLAPQPARRQSGRQDVGEMGAEAMADPAGHVAKNGELVGCAAGDLYPAT
jgi:hypothetical protein